MAQQNHLASFLKRKAEYEASARLNQLAIQVGALTIGRHKSESGEGSCPC